MAPHQSPSAVAPVPGAPVEPGPIFIAGRQHCGNTVLARILSLVPGCFTTTDENLFFEQRALCDGLRAGERVERVLELLRVRADEHAAVRNALRDPALTSSSAVELYRRGMDALARRHAKSFWVQKATSYVFYADEILAALHDARIVYLVRDPFDICASKKRRDPHDDRLVGLALGWNRGYRLALDLEMRHPERFRIVAYERLVRAPHDVLSDLFAFLGLEYDEAYLAVRHLNRSEARYCEDGPVTGLTQSRVGYHVDVLGFGERRALSWLIDGSLLERHRSWGGLSRQVETRAGLARPCAQLALHAARFAGLHLARAAREPRVTLARTWRRIRPRAR